MITLSIEQLGKTTRLKKSKLYKKKKKKTLKKMKPDIYPPEPYNCTEEKQTSEQ